MSRGLIADQFAAIRARRNELRLGDPRNVEEQCRVCGAPKRAWIVCDRWDCLGPSQSLKVLGEANVS